MKTGADLEETRNASLDFNLTGSWPRHAGEDFEQGRFACAVAPNNAENPSPFDFKADVLQGPELLPHVTGMMLFTYLSGRVWRTAYTSPPAGDIVLQRAAADRTQTIGL